MCNYRYAILNKAHLEKNLPLLRHSQNTVITSMQEEVNKHIFNCNMETLIFGPFAEFKITLYVNIINT